MATANRKTKIELVEKEIPDGIVLNLSEEEAEVLKWLLGRCSGSETSANKYSRSVYIALDLAGVESKEFNYRLMSNCVLNIHFTN